MKNPEQNFLPIHVTTPWQKLSVSNAFSEDFEWEASPVGQSLQQKDKKRKKKGKKKNEKLQDAGHFKILISAHA